MRQAADLGKGDDGSGAARLNRPGDRTVLAQSQMRARAVIIGDVRRKDPPQLRLVEDDDVVEALSPDGADDPFDERAFGSRLSWWCRRMTACDAVDGAPTGIWMP